MTEKNRKFLNTTDYYLPVTEADSEEADTIPVLKSVVEGRIFISLFTLLCGLEGFAAVTGFRHEKITYKKTKTKLN